MGHRDFETEQAAAIEDRKAALAARQDAWKADRRLELIALLETQPLMACMPSCFSGESAPPVGVELVAWAMQSADGERALAEAIYSITARHRLHQLFAEQAAEHECSKKPESAWCDS